MYDNFKELVNTIPSVKFIPEDKNILNKEIVKKRKKIDKKKL